MYSWLQSLQYSRLLFPCSSEIRSYTEVGYELSWTWVRSGRIEGRDAMLTGSMPLFLCNPSQFWLTRYLSMPRFCNSTRAMWLAVGMA